MKGYTENSAIIFRNIDEVFDLTNNIEMWPQLFTEYEKAEVLEKTENYVKFKLTTHPDAKGRSKSWISERRIDKENLEIHAKRLDPMFPFKYMNITWTYEVLPKNVGVNMTWIQEFEVDENCPHDVYDMESYLNASSRVQIKDVKKAVERMLTDNSSLS